MSTYKIKGIKTVSRFLLSNRNKRLMQRDERKILKKDITIVIRIYDLKTP